MDSTGKIRVMVGGETPRADEIPLTSEEAKVLSALTREERMQIYADLLPAPPREHEPLGGSRVLRAAQRFVDERNRKRG